MIKNIIHKNNFVLRLDIYVNLIHSFVSFYHECCKCPIESIVNYRLMFVVGMWNMNPHSNLKPKPLKTLKNPRTLNHTWDVGLFEVA
jgi:hypothetical protein